MLVTLRLTDGTVQSVDVEMIEAMLGSSRVELSFEGDPARLRVYARGDDRLWHSLAVFPGAANTLNIEATAHGPAGAG